MIRKLAWFVGLWFAGVLTFAVVAYGLRAIILPNGEPAIIDQGGTTGE